MKSVKLEITDNEKSLLTLHFRDLESLIKHIDDHHFTHDKALAQFYRTRISLIARELASIMGFIFHE